MHVHILGIGGVFMAGLALIARALGYRVTGCDGPLYPPMSEVLAAQGMTPFVGYDADQVRLRPDLFIIGNAISRGNPLLEEILERNLPYVSGPQWLSEAVLRNRWVLAVAGTHGKTTTTAMLAHVLEQTGHAPGYLIGGVPLAFDAPAALGSGRTFVIEADEYDTAFCDKRAKFVHYRPRTFVINHLEYDHADIYPDLAAIETQFHHAIRLIPRSGRVIARAGLDAIDRVLARGCWSDVARFGARGEKAHWQVARDGERVAFWRDEDFLGEVQLALPGEHNAFNALAAVAAAEHVGVAPQEAIAALGTFAGVRRRQEMRGVAAGVTVYDDFAHHPTAIAATLAALRPQVSGRLIAVFEPRSNTMKLGTLQAALPGALAQADAAWCYAAGLAWDAAAALAPLGGRARVRDDLAALVAEVAAFAQPGDAVVVMSNGAFGGVHERLLAALAARGESSPG